MNRPEDCHHEEEVTEKTPSCCHSEENPKTDWLLWISLAVLVTAYAAHLIWHQALAGIPFAGSFCHGVFELFNKMWWGLLVGVALVSALAKVPREFVVAILGPGGGLVGLLRATFAGLLLDRILLVGMQLYRRGASLGQTIAFLVASPWNSLSLTIVLIALIGWKWTVVFVFISGIIALVTGLIFEALTRRGVLAANPNSTELPADFRFFREAKSSLTECRFDVVFFGDMIREGLSESRMILRWIFFGTVLAAAIRAALPSDEVFANWFGPSVLGLGLTLIAATIIEVCSEGSSPVAADLLNRGGAPGNALTFLMAGAATDYTEILGLKETTKSLKIALFLPLVSVPQVLVAGWILNQIAL